MDKKKFNTQNNNYTIYGESDSDSVIFDVSLFEKYGWIFLLIFHLYTLPNLFVSQYETPLQFLYFDL